QRPAPPASEIVARTASGGPIDLSEAPPEESGGMGTTASRRQARWGRTAIRVGAQVVAAAALGSWASDPSSRWYRRLDKPDFQPPPAAFPIVWSSLYGAIWAASTATIHRFERRGQTSRSRGFRRA